MIVHDILARQIRSRHSTICCTGLTPRLRLEETLGLTNGRETNNDHPYHAGCVNTIRFGHQEHSNFLLTGSDDQTLKLWDVSGTARHQTTEDPRSSRAPLSTFDTGHTSNILSACFVRGTSFFASVGMRGEVRLTTTVTSQTLRIDHHKNGAYDARSIPHEPDLFWTCGEDGCVNQYDLRCRSQLGKQCIIQSYDTDSKSAFVSMSFNPLNPVYLALGCSSDPIVRIYDRRKLSEFDPSQSAVVLSCGAPAVVNAVRENAKRGRVTSVVYNRQGTELLVSYSHDYVYLFDVSGNHQEQHAMDSSSSSDRPKTRKPINFKVCPNDWSDTGPESSRRSTDATEQSPGERMAYELQLMLTQAFGGGGGGGGGDDGNEQEEEQEQEQDDEQDNEQKEERDTKEETKEQQTTDNGMGSNRHNTFIHPRATYRGHRNCRTIIKECNFYGMNDELIMSGSDDGRIFFWEKTTARVLGALVSDTRVVNCVQRREEDLLLASSGIDHNIKLFTPTGSDRSMRVPSLACVERTRRKRRRGGKRVVQAEEEKPDVDDGIDAIVQNNETMLAEQKAGSVVRLPSSLVLRMLVRMRRQQARERAAQQEEEGEDDDDNDVEDE